MKLYLAQHGEALPREEDPERPLSQQGRRDVQAIAKMLDAAGIRVARVWHSGKRRAGQTAAIIAERVCPRCRTEAIDGIKPNDSTAEFSQDVDVWQEDTLIVGHLPFMSRLVSGLVCGDPERELVSYYPGSVVCLERSGAHSWSVQWMLRPDVFAAHRQAED
jgi:phosphohistidine phosphatase